MAYVPKELKAKVHTALKDIIPKTWKWSLAVQHHSILVLTISKAPVDLLTLNDGHRDLNVHWYKDHFKTAPKEVLELLVRIVTAMNTDNHNRSDIQSDYFDVGHYVTVQFGKWNKSFTISE